MDPKVHYLAKTLSRTKRKDYENYVVNAIWNRIDDTRLVPVSQQYVKDENGNYYFIDLYFPQLKLGVECDEGYHASKEQKILDAEREATIIDVMKQVDGSDYTALHVDVTKTYDEVEQQINSHVQTIRKKIEELNIQDGWTLATKMIRCSWTKAKPQTEEQGMIENEIAAYFRDKEFITVDDNIVFPTNKEVYNIILGQNYSYHLMHGGEPFKKLYTEYGYEEGTFPWFPKLTLKKPTKKGYYNLFSKDGMEIREYIDDPAQNRLRMAENRYIGKKRVVFSQVEDFRFEIEEPWDTGYKHAEAYYEQNGNLSVAKSYVCFDGYRLGNWIAGQRHQYSVYQSGQEASITKEQIDKLNQISMIWNVFEYNWRKAFTALLEYIQINDTVRISKRYITQEGINLNSWLNEQRKAQKLRKIKPNHERLLIECGVLDAVRE